MNLKKYYRILQTRVAAQQPNFGDNADNVLELLYGAYNEYNNWIPRKSNRALRISTRP